eukprot:463704-Karenia_brevis.AAC.1
MAKGRSLHSGLSFTSAGLHKAHVKLAKELTFKVDNVDAWAAPSVIRFQAAFRHFSQACARKRSWAPKEMWMEDSEESKNNCLVFKEPSVAEPKDALADDHKIVGCKSEPTSEYE